MEVLIFGIASLIWFVIFVGISCVPALAAYWLGRMLPFPFMRWLLPSIALALPISWAFVSYSVFESSCATIPKTQFFATPEVKADGFLLDSNRIRRDNLIEQAVFQFVEELQPGNLRRNFAGKKLNDWAPIPMETEFVPHTSSKSQYVVTELEPKKVEYWWSPPIYVHGLEVMEKDSRKLLARSTELVFGGGLISPYMRLFGGDQDFERISCGYVSIKPGVWRPTLTSRPRFQQYLDTDARFLVRALGGPKVDVMEKIPSNFAPGQPNGVAPMSKP